jgi:hypothetical protein
MPAPLMPPPTISMSTWEGICMVAASVNKDQSMRGHAGMNFYSETTGEQMCRAYEFL